MKACDGIVLNPMKGAHLVAQPIQPLSASRYTPPSKRKEEPKTLTKDDINSDILFPTLTSLSPMKPMTSGASWSELRSRLNPFSVLSEDDTINPVNPVKMNFSLVVEEQIKREKLELEEGIRRDAITDPKEMSIEQRTANGWATLRTPPNFLEFNQRATKILTEEDYYDAGNSFDTQWQRGMPVECVHLGGAPIEREKTIDYFAKFSPDTPTIYSPIVESSVKRAKAKAFAFFGKKCAV